MLPANQNWVFFNLWCLLDGVSSHLIPDFDSLEVDRYQIPMKGTNKSLLFCDRHVRSCSQPIRLEYCYISIYLVWIGISDFNFLNVYKKSKFLKRIYQINRLCNFFSWFSRWGVLFSCTCFFALIRSCSCNWYVFF